jgi:methylated-DNA-protein-cysteine methyltransferase-like protein
MTAHLIHHGRFFLLPRVRRGASKATRTRTDRQALTTYARIYAVVRRVPRGRVATYGQVARIAGLGSHARMVGYALAALPDGTTVPWHRIINSRGTVSQRRSGDSLSQRLRLEREGVSFDTRGRASFATHGWRPRVSPRRG